MDDLYENCWIRQHFDRIRVNCTRMRLRCKADNCEKEYSIKSSHTPLKRHWAQCHSLDMSPKKTVFTFSDNLLTDTIIKFIIGCQKEYSIVESKYFVNMIEAMIKNNRLPNRKTVSEIIIRKTNALELQVKAKLSTAISVALTLDIWTTRSLADGYATITGHYIDDEMRMNKVTLEFKQLPHPHTGLVIEEFILETLTRFELKDKIISITTDQASNNILAIDLLTQDLNLTANYNVGFVHCRCIAHMIHLCVKESFESINPLLEDIRSVVRIVRSSTSRTEKFIEAQKRMDQDCCQPLKLKRDCDTRWNSTYLMLKRAFQLKNVIQTVQIEIDELRQVPSINWHDIEDILSFLRPFYDVTETLSGECYPTISFVTKLVPKMLDHARKEYGNELICEAGRAFAAKLENYTKFTDVPLITLSSVLDPRIKSSFLPPELNYLAKQLLTNYTDSEQNDSLSTQVSQTQSSILDDLFVHRAADEVSVYLSLPLESGKTNILNYWKTNQESLPKLSNLARMVLAIQATSVPSERIFSVASMLDVPKRNRLSREAFRSNMLLKSWLEFLNIC